jgi:hypothetical protein
MSQTPVLIEPSFVDAIAVIATADELPKQTQRHWTTSLRQIAKALDKPLEVIPARLTALRADLARLCMSSEHFGQLAWQFKRVSGSSGLKVQAAIAC